MKKALATANFCIALVAALMITSCARMDQRAERYNPKECPFCTTKPGTCTYCEGTGKCSFCEGTGKRVNSTKNMPDPEIKKLDYEIPCPFCKATGTCRYCDGKGKCWVCKGTAKIESWEFYEQFKKELKGQ
jgi:RecJ-like exonuclease